MLLELRVLALPAARARRDVPIAPQFRAHLLMLADTHRSAVFDRTVLPAIRH
jgi:hypothetical protein